MKNKIALPILITGASGFIGSNLLRGLIKKNIVCNIIIRKKSQLFILSYYKILLLKHKIFNLTLGVIYARHNTDCIYLIL